jgi:predicted RND superfamily exporter protein
LLSPGKNSPRYYEKAFTGADLLDRLTSPPASLSTRVAAARLKGTLLGPDGKRAAVALTPSDYGRAHLRGAVDAVYLAAASLGISRDQLHLGGPPVDNVTIDLEGERLIVRLMGLCGLIGLSLAWWYLRDWRLTLMVLVGGVYSAGICLALVWLLGGTMNSILLTMPAVVYTAGLATAIHMINYHRDVVERTGLKGAAERALHAAWIPCSLSAGTTAIGLISLTVSELVPIRTFGFYTALGVLATIGFMYLYLPAALQLWPPRRLDKSQLTKAHRREARHFERMHWLAANILSRPRGVWIGFFALLIGCGLGLTRAQTTINLMSLFPADARIIQDYAWLERDIGPLVPMELVVRFDNATNKQTMLERMRIVAEIQRAAHKIPAVGGTMSAVTFAPELSRAQTSGFRAALLPGKTFDSVLNKRLVAHRDELIQDGYLAIDRASNQEWWRVSLRVAALKNIDYGAFITDIQHQVEPIVARERQQGVKGLVGVTYTGMTPIVYMAERALLDSLVHSFFGAFVMIAAVMSIVFRNLAAGLLTMLPNVFPMAVVFGLMSWLGIVLDIGTMMTASVAMGVCVDDTVHFANWFRRGLRAGLPRRQAVLMAFENSAGAIYQSTAIVALGLVTFAISSFVPTRRFGVLMFTLLSCGLVADLVLTPVILAGPLGRFFTRGTILDEPAGESVPMDENQAVAG